MSAKLQAVKAKFPAPQANPNDTEQTSLTLKGSESSRREELKIHDKKLKVIFQLFLAWM